MPEGVVPRLPVPALQLDGSTSAIDIAAEIRALFEARPGALITDIDGTISPIVARPEDAVVAATVRECLERLALSLDLVAVVTRRDRTTAQAMVGARGVTYIGNYGLDGDNFGAGSIRGAFADSRMVAGDMPCVQLEDKGASFALHYRNC